MTFRDIDRIDGFVIPKADLLTLPAYFEILANHDQFEIMVTLETRVAFDLTELYRLRDYLTESPLRPRITALRIGSLDLLSILSLRRDITKSIYETPVGHTIDQLITVFKPANLDLTAPCFEGLSHQETLAQELSLDINRGLFAKTAIHPSQIDVIHTAYQVGDDELEMAKATLDPSNPAIFRLGNRMCEKAVHANWAATVLERARLFGTRGIAAGALNDPIMEITYAN
jgi:citrate lyase beta subunit